MVCDAHHTATSSMQKTTSLRYKQLRCRVCLGYGNTHPKSKFIGRWSVVRVTSAWGFFTFQKAWSEIVALKPVIMYPPINRYRLFYVASTLFDNKMTSCKVCVGLIGIPSTADRCITSRPVFKITFAFSFNCQKNKKSGVKLWHRRKKPCSEMSLTSL